MGLNRYFYQEPRSARPRVASGVNLLDAPRQTEDGLVIASNLVNDRAASDTPTPAGATSNESAASSVRTSMSSRFARSFARSFAMSKCGEPVEELLALAHDDRKLDRFERVEERTSEFTSHSFPAKCEPV